MQEKTDKNRTFSLLDSKEEDGIQEVVGLVQSVKELDLLKRDPVVQLLLLELSKDPKNSAVKDALFGHLRPHAIKHELKPSMFKIPPKE